jgi:hypothetical protein
MTTQPEALQLADWCDTFNTVQHDKAAAELRRLHTANAKLLKAMENIERSTHDQMTATLARAAIARAEAQP